MGDSTSFRVYVAGFPPKARPNADLNRDDWPIAASCLGVIVNYITRVKRVREMNVTKTNRVVSQIAVVKKLPKGFSSTQSLIAVASIALLLLLALFSASEQTASEAQFDAKLKTAAAAVDSGMSNVQKFFPASFR